MAVDAFAEKLEELRRRFRAGLPRQVAEMERLAAAEDWSAMRAVAHKLAGQGGTFGEPAISEAAAAVEDAAPDGVSAALATLAAVVRRVG